MFGYIDYAPAGKSNQGYEVPWSYADAFSGTSGANPANNQIFGYGGSYKRNVVQTKTTECHDYFSFGTVSPVVEQPRSNQAKVREVTSRIKNENRKTGSYERVTMKEKMTKGKTHVEKSTGRKGIANEYKKSATVKIGDKSGYTEYYHEEKVRRVNYDGKSNSRLKQGNKNTTITVNRANAGIKKKNSSISFNHGKNKSICVSINYTSNKKGSSSGKRGAK